MESTRTPTPAEALDLVAGTRADLADRLVTPWWYHPALGLLVGALVASFARDSNSVTMVAFGVYLVGIGSLMRAYRRKTGLWVNGLSAGRASRWGVWMGVVTGVVMVAAVILANVGVPIAPVIGGALMVPLVVWFGHRFDEELRADLRKAP